MSTSTPAASEPARIGRRRPFPYRESTALVTGASRGIGAEIARALAARGIGTLVLSARTGADLDSLASELRGAHPTLRVETVRANLAEPQAPARIREATDRLGLSIDLLVNNAGFGAHGVFEEVGAAKDDDMIAVNVTSLVALTHLYLPAMVARGRGGVLNVASTASFQPVPFMTTYAATKAFVLSFSEGLWAECQEKGVGADVRVVCLCPGGTETNFGDGMKRGRFESSKQSSPREVADAGLEALDRGVPFHVVGTANYVGTLGARILPRATLARFTAGMFRPDDLLGAPPRPDTATKIGAAVGVGLAVAVGVGAAVLVGRRRQADSGALAD